MIFSIAFLFRPSKIFVRMEWSRPAFRILVISSILLGFILFPNISDGHASLYPNNRVAVHSYDLSSQSHISKSKELADNLVSELIKKSSSSFGPVIVGFFV
jgi:hypothetical protein